MKRVLSAILMLVMVIGLLGMQSAFAAVHTEEGNLELLPYSYISMYPGDTLDDYVTRDKDGVITAFTSAGNGKRMTVWNDLLFVPVYYEKIKGTDPNRNQLFVYDLSYDKPTLFAKWNMQELSMKIRSTADVEDDEDAITGVYVDDDNIYISVISTDTTASYKRMQGLYIYENNIDREAETVTPPIRLTDATVQASDAGWIKTCNQPVAYNVPFMRGSVMQKVGDYLVTIHEAHTVTTGIKSAHISVTDVSNPLTANDSSVTVINEGDLLTYESGGTAKVAENLYDAKFEGSYAYILCGNKTDLEYILFRVDFSDPINPTVANYLVIDGTNSSWGKPYFEMEGNNGYITVSGTAGNIDSNRLYTIDMTDRADMAFIADLCIRDSLFTISNETNYDAKSTGLGAFSVAGNLIVGIEEGSAYNYVIRLMLSEDRTEIYDGSATFSQSNEAMASSMSSYIYGQKAYFTSITPKYTNLDTAKAAILSMIDFSALTPYDVSIDNFAGTKKAPFTISGSVYGLPCVTLEIDNGTETITEEIEAIWHENGSNYGEWSYTFNEIGDYDIKAYASDYGTPYLNTEERINLSIDGMLERKVKISALSAGEFKEGNLPVKITVSNTTESSVTGVPIVAAYNGKELVAAEVGNLATIGAMEDMNIGTITLNLPAEPIDGYSDYVVKTFFWKSTNTIAPYSGNVIQNAVNPISSADELTALDWTIVRNTQLLSGVTDETGKADRYASGKTYPMSVYDDLLIVPITYSGLETADKNKIVVYNLTENTIDYTQTSTTLIDGTTSRIYPDAQMTAQAEWNMTDLGMTVAESGTQDTIAGTYVSDDYIFVPVVKAEEDGTKTMGLYIYHNTLKTNPTKAPAMVSDGMIELYNNNHATALPILSNYGVKMKLIGSKLVMIPAGTTLHRVKGAKIAVVDLSDTENITVSTFLGYSLIKKGDGTDLGVDGVAKDTGLLGDVVFVGNKCYMPICDTPDSNAKYLAVVDFSYPANPVWERSIALGAGVDTAATILNISASDGYVYVTTSGDKAYESSYMYVVKLSDMSVSSIGLADKGLGAMNSAGFGVTAVKGDVLLNFDGYLRIFATYRMELNEAKNDLLHSAQTINAIHSNGIFSQANGYVIYGQKVFVSLNAPTNQSRLGLCDIYDCAPFAVYDLSSIHINY